MQRAEVMGRALLCLIAPQPRSKGWDAGTPCPEPLPSSHGACGPPGHTAGSSPDRREEGRGCSKANQKHAGVNTCFQTAPLGGEGEKGEFQSRFQSVVMNAVSQRRREGTALQPAGAISSQRRTPRRVPRFPEVLKSTQLSIASQVQKRSGGNCRERLGLGRESCFSPPGDILGRRQPSQQTLYCCSPSAALSQLQQPLTTGPELSPTDLPTVPMSTRLTLGPSVPYNTSSLCPGLSCSTCGVSAHPHGPTKFPSSRRRWLPCTIPARSCFISVCFLSLQIINAAGVRGWQNARSATNRVPAATQLRGLLYRH